MLISLLVLISFVAKSYSNGVTISFNLTKLDIFELSRIILSILLIGI